MPKKNWLWLLLLWAVCLNAEDYLRTQTQSTKGETTLQAGWQYQHSLYGDWLLSQTGTTQMLDNTFYNRTSRQYNLGWSVGRYWNDWNMQLLFAYDQNSDKADIGSGGYNQDALTKSTGLSVGWQPTGFFSTGSTFWFRHKDGRDINGRYEGDGGSGTVNFNLNGDNGATGYSLKPQYTLVNQVYDKEQSLGGRADWYWQMDSGRLNLFSELADNTNKLYRNRSYDDRQDYRRLYSGLAYRGQIYPELSIGLGANGTQEDNLWKTNKTKEYKARTADMTYNLAWQRDRVAVTLDGEHSQENKDFYQSSNDRRTEIKVFAGKVIWYINAADSLSFSRRLGLTSSHYPAADNEQDNDLLTDSYQLSSLWRWGRQCLNLTGGYDFKHEVYPAARMSAANNKKHSYTFHPEVYSLFWQGRVLLAQSYLLRADYNDFDFDKAGSTVLVDRFYRKLSAEYSWIFTGTTVSNSPRPGMGVLSYWRSPEHACLALVYKLESQQAGEEARADVYAGADATYTHTITVELSQPLFWDINLRLKPKFVLASDREFNHVVELSRVWGRDNEISINLNPSGTSIHDAIYRLNANVAINF